MNLAKMDKSVWSGLMTVNSIRPDRKKIAILQIAPETGFGVVDSGDRRWPAFGFLRYIWVDPAGKSRTQTPGSYDGAIC